MLGHKYTPLIFATGISTLVLAAFLLKSQAQVAPAAQATPAFPAPVRNTVLETAALLKPAEVGLPINLEIPSIGVDASVIFLGLNEKGAIDVPRKPEQVAWFDLGPRPGEKGTAVLVGHYGPWINGDPSVFDHLGKVSPGDKVLVHDSKGKEYSFTVRESRVYDPNETALEVFDQPGDGFHLNIITCNGDWISAEQTYNRRLVIFTDLD